MIADAETQNRTAHKENYRELLPVFIEPTEVSGSTHTQLMDSVIGKARRVINEKSKGKYVNEAWLLMGQANYLKGNYYNAAEYFDYLTGVSTGFPKLRQQAFIWQARALMQLEAHHAAEEVLDSVVAGLEHHKRSRGHAQAALAKFHLQQGQEKQAITALSRALSHRGNKRDKLRWHYLLAQLLERNNYREDAIRHYRRVARSNVDYEMAFNASLSQLFLETRGHPDEKRQLRAFRSMLRDDKNKEFRDQILFYTGETHYRYGRYDEAIKLFNQSLAAATANPYQRATTYMRLADHYFENSKFLEALAYYDSTAMILPIDYPDAEPVQRKLSHVGELISHLRVVERQDSLLYLGELDVQQREQVLDSIITVRYEALLAADEANHRSRRRRSSSEDVRISPFDRGHTENIQAYADNRFYFNNVDAIGMGLSAFRRAWGDRELQDNWRWSSIHTTADDLGDEAQASEIPVADAELSGNVGDAADGTPDSLQFAASIRTYYESDLPLEPEQIRAAHEQIQTALENVGELYRYGFWDHQAAEESYLALLERYPTDARRSLWLYHLVLLAGPDAPRSASYKAILAAEFPESLYHKILADPNYLSNLKDERKRLSEQYNDVYQLYLEGSYDGVIQLVSRLMAAREQDQAGEDEHLSMYAQLAYLKALAIGRTTDPLHFRSELEDLIDTFDADSLVTPLAKHHLAFMDAHAEEFANRSFALIGAGLDSMHFVDEPALMRWPQLVIRRRAESEPTRDTRTFERAGTRQQPANTTAGLTTGTVEHRQFESTRPIPSDSVAEHPADASRDLTILPDIETYYFVINVMHPRVNLAPSRFGIGQFNRTRYAGQPISHQVKLIENEAQLIYVGPFSSYDDVKQYERGILPMITDIMKVPEDVYNTFVITESIFGTLSDFEMVDDYATFYRGQ